MSRRPDSVVPFEGPSEGLKKNLSSRLLGANERRSDPDGQNESLALSNEFEEVARLIAERMIGPIVRALRTAHAQGVLAAKLPHFDPIEDDRTEKIADLTRTQREVLWLLADGRSNAAIGETLGMCESTVKTHVKQVLKRLGVQNRTQAALIARIGKVRR